MKNIINIILVVSLFLTLASCNEKLETVPYDQIDIETGINNPDQLEMALLGAYGRLRDESYYGGEFLIKADLYSDNLILNTEGRLSNKTNYEWRYDPNNSWALNYYTYRTVYAANVVLKNIEHGGTLADNIEGEAKFLRALAHFDALRNYSKIPTQSSDANASLGLPFVTEPDPQILPSRLTVAESYANIISDLTTAASLINVDNGEGRVGKAGVYALLSRVYLYMGEWQKAESAANSAITNSLTDVASQDVFASIWTDDSRDGLLFYVRNTSQDDITVGVPYSQTSSSGIKSEYVVDYAFYNLFDDTDIRKSAYIITSDFSGNSYNNVIKYYKRTSGNQGVVDMKVIRMSEVYLNLAEAAYRQNKPSIALGALDKLRENRYADFVSPEESGAALLESIKLERRLELAFEGHRFYDIKRWGESVTRSDFGHFSDGTGNPALYKVLSAGDHKFQLPINQDEINVNPNMVQNPGYVE